MNRPLELSDISHIAINRALEYSEVSYIARNRPLELSDISHIAINRALENEVPCTFAVKGVHTSGNHHKSIPDFFLEPVILSFQSLTVVNVCQQLLLKNHKSLNPKLVPKATRINPKMVSKTISMNPKIVSETKPKPENCFQNTKLNPNLVPKSTNQNPKTVSKKQKLKPEKAD